MGRTHIALLVCAHALLLSAVNATYFLTPTANYQPAHQTFCESQNGQLAVIKSQADQDAVMAFALANPVTPADHYHIGIVKCSLTSSVSGLDCSGANVYSWVDGTPYVHGSDFENWYPTGNQELGQSSENYIVLKTTANGQWMQGSGAYYGICETVSSSCTETEALDCHELAYCESGACTCFTGIIGDGTTCSTKGYAARLSVDITGNTVGETGGKLSPWVTDNQDAVALSIFGLSGADASSMSHALTTVSENGSSKLILSLNAVFATNAEAVAARNFANTLFSTSPATEVMPGVAISNRQVDCRVYAYEAPTSDGPLQVMPAGLTVDSVYFDTSCANTGCWVIDFTFTTSKDAFNTLYIPRTAGNDQLSYDLGYSAVEDATFDAANFPCSPDSTHTAASTSTVWPTSTCCIKQAVQEYRTLHLFDDWEDNLGCPDVVERPDYEGLFDVAFPEQFHQGFLTGNMSDIAECWVEFGTTIDPYIGIYTGTLKCDEVELRNNAGILKGTVGVEHTIDTFLGIANFKPTGLEALDSFASQTAIHLEKTSFFSVATHGTNDYTFLEYVNLRLVAIYVQDSDFSETTSEFADRTSRTNSSDAAHYVQVTFTLGSQYQPNANTGIVPLDSVRVGSGDFFSEDGVQQHACAQWDAAFSDVFDRKADFVSRLAQEDCAPSATMCSNPTDIPDQFVSFNVPLGFDWLPSATDDLSENVFVSMVISAIDTTTYSTAPNMGGEAKQMKTTLTASIPVVEGGVNIFCDTLVAKTDLEDVANADIILGTAKDATELLSLTTLVNITNTNLGQTESQLIETDSIESGFMTLVVKGDPTYFQNSGTGGYSLELEDVITVHIMEEGTTKFDFVKGKLDEAPQDNNNDLDGYYLNGAFRFWISRAEQRAHLEPTAELLAECPFNPPRPAAGSATLATCVVRRDVRYRAFPHRVGGWSTAMEIARPGSDGEDEKRFMQTVLGQSEYAADLGTAYAGVIDTEYTLNGRFKRAWWINPGYEWTPTQTGGESIFTLSQTIFMFALINLNENFQDVSSFDCDAYANSQEVGDICFFAPGGIETWDAAQAECEKVGGSLASLTSAADATAAKAAGAGATGNFMWVGPNDIATEGTWVNPDLSPAFTQWGTNQPNNGAGNEHCSAFWTTSTAGLVDLDCAGQYPYVCSAPMGQFESPDVHLPPLPSRRMLLSSTTEDSGAGVGASVIKTTTTPRKMMADAFGVPADRVATFSVEMALSESEACMQGEKLQGELRGKLEALLAEHASQFETVQVVAMTVHRGDVTCDLEGGARRRLSRVLLSSPASAEVEMLVVFSRGTTSQIDLLALQQQTGILAVEKLVADKVELVQPEVPDKDVVRDDAAAEGDASTDGGSDSTALIVGVAAGVVGAVILAGAAFLVVRKRAAAKETQPEVVSAVSITDLKAQLCGEV